MRRAAERWGGKEKKERESQLSVSWLLPSKIAQCPRLQMMELRCSQHLPRRRASSEWTVQDTLMDNQ